MRLELENRAISRVTAGGTARSYYFRAKYSNDDMYVNKADGDTLTFRFEHGQLVGTKIVGYGGGLGTGEYLQYSPVEKAAPADSAAVKARAATTTDASEPRGKP